VPQRRLDEEFPLSSNTSLLPLLRRLLGALERRFQALEADRASEASTLELIRSTALDRINQTITPLIVSTTENIRQIAEIFRANIAGVHTVGMGEKTFDLDEEDRATFAALDYVTIRANADPTASMTGDVVSYDHTTGELVVDVGITTGAGTYTGWTAAISAPPDIVHALRTDDPHQSAAQAIAAIRAGVAGGRDTLFEISAALDAHAGNLSDPHQSAAQAVTTVRGGVDASLDTLNKMAVYLQGYAAAIAAKADKVSPTFTGTMQLYNLNAESSGVFGGQLWGTAVAAGPAAEQAGVSARARPANDMAMVSFRSNDGATHWGGLGCNPPGAQTSPLTLLHWPGNVMLGEAVYRGCRLTMNFAGGSITGLVSKDDSAGTASHIIFLRGTTVVGSISTSAGVTSFNSTSDEKLKEDLREFDAGDIIDRLETWDFRWKGTDVRSHGVVAQHARHIYPEAISEPQAKLRDEDGSEVEDYYKADYSRFVPLLLNEMKRLRARVAELERR
jgi:hypothetical protein